LSYALPAANNGDTALKPASQITTDDKKYCRPFIRQTPQTIFYAIICLASNSKTKPWQLTAAWPLFVLRCHRRSGFLYQISVNQQHGIGCFYWRY